MTKYAKVEGHPNLLRDLNSNAIINTDKISLDAYSLAKLKREEDYSRIESIESDLTELKSAIDDIKQLLRDLK